MLLSPGTANAAPYNSHIGGRRGGDELYAASIIAIHADDGRMAWYYQTVPQDRWDFDSTQKLVLADIDLAGRRREQPLFSVHDEHVGLGMLDLDAERAQCLDGAQAIVTREEAAQDANPVG